MHANVCTYVRGDLIRPNEKYNHHHHHHRHCIAVFACRPRFDDLVYRHRHRRYLGVVVVVFARPRLRPPKSIIIIMISVPSSCSSSPPSIFATVLIPSTLSISMIICSIPCLRSRLRHHSHTRFDPRSWIRPVFMLVVFASLLRHRHRLHTRLRLRVCFRHPPSSPSSSSVVLMCATNVTTLRLVCAPRLLERL